MLNMLIDAGLLIAIMLAIKEYRARIANHRDLISRQTEIIAEHWRLIKQYNERLDELERR